MQDSSDEDLEVVYDEDYDPQREEELKQQLAAKQGSLSGYWARLLFQLSIIHRMLQSECRQVLA